MVTSQLIDLKSNILFIILKYYLKYNQINNNNNVYLSLNQPKYIQLHSQKYQGEIAP